MGISSTIRLDIKKLSQTSAEQAILRNIQALELALNTEKDKKRIEELTDQINDLKSNIANVGTNVSFLEKEDLTNQVIELKKEVFFLQSELKKTSKRKTIEKKFGKHFEEDNARFKLYELLLAKYSDLINEFEKKTVGEIKAMVNPEDLTVQSLAQDFKKENYLFEKNYYSAGKKAFNFISNEITFVKSSLDLNFWLKPKEIMNKKVGDDEDLAVFLCSVLSSLGDKQAEVIIAELENMSTHAFVITEIKNQFFLLDPSQNHKFEEFIGEKSKVLGQYSFNDSKVKRFLYKFNSEKYEQFV